MFIQAISLFQGFLIGLLVAIPLGPLGIITMRRTAEHGLSAGIIAGITVSLMDGVFAALLLFGVQLPASVSRPIPHYISLLGSLIIFWYGFSMYNKKSVAEPKKISRWDYHFADTLWLAFSNPSTYFAFGGTALLLSPFLLRGESARAVVAIGFFLGTLVWWFTLVTIAHKKRDAYLKNMTIQKVLGVLVMVIAVWTAINTFIPQDRPHRIEKILKKI